MPKGGFNVYFSITDGGSPVLASISDKTRALDKQTQQLSQTYGALQKANEGLRRKQAELEKQLVSARKEAKEAEKAFSDLGDEANAEAFTKATQKQEALREQLRLTTQTIKENERAYKSNLDTIRKGTGSTDGLTGIAKGLMAGQLGALVAGALGGAGGAALSSGIGSGAAGILSGALSSAIAGAAAGSIIPGIGTAIGAAVGAGSGLVSGATQIFEGRDDAFRDYYGGLYDTVNAGTDEMVSSGSTTAGSREQTMLAFAKRLGGMGAARTYLSRVGSFAANTNYDYDEITGYSKLLLNTYAPEEVFGVLQSLSDATAGLSLNSSDISVMISGLSRMRTTGKTTQEYLNYFSERGVDVYAALAGLAGGKDKVAGKVTAGQIGGADAAQAILDYIDSTYGGLSEDLIGTFEAMTDNLQDIMTSLGAAGGEGYNQMRKSGLAADMEAYGGALGQAMEEMNRISGENRAYLENLSGQYLREAREAVLMGGQAGIFSEGDQAKLAGLRGSYVAAQQAYAQGDQEAGLLMESYLESAEAIAKAAYESSEQYKTLRDVQMDQLEAIRENTQGLAASTAAYQESQERSKGGLAGYFNDLRNNLVTVNGLGGGKENVIQVTVSGNSFTAAGEELADQVGEVVARKLEQAVLVEAG